MPVRLAEVQDFLLEIWRDFRAPEFDLRAIFHVKSQREVLDWLIKQKFKNLSSFRIF